MEMFVDILLWRGGETGGETGGEREKEKEESGRGDVSTWQCQVLIDGTLIVGPFFFLFCHVAARRRGGSFSWPGNPFQLKNDRNLPLSYYNGP